MVEIRKDGKCVMRSQNLRAVTRYARERAPCDRAVLLRGRAAVTLDLSFTDGAHTTIDFASGSVAREWAIERGLKNPNFTYRTRITDQIIDSDGNMRATLPNEMYGE